MAYKKISAFPKEFTDNLVWEKLKELKSSWIMKSSKKKVIKEINNMYDGSEFTDADYDQMVTKHRTDISRLEAEGFNYLVENIAKWDVTFEKYLGEWYYNIGFDTPFRVYGYPEDTFTSMERLLGWLKRYWKAGNVIGYYKDDGTFIEGYTLELEEKIKKYYNLHGKDNLLFHFG